MTLSIPTDDLVVEPSLNLTAPLALALVCGVLIAVVAITLAVVLSRPRRTPAKDTARGAHSTAAGKSIWHARIDAVVSDHRNGVIDREEAFLRLAAIAREYASAVSGKDMSGYTLSDLHRERRDSRNRNGLNLLRQTIEALYPAEFADPTANSLARGVEVEQAAEWVSTLVERWRA